LRISEQEMQDLPPVAVDHPGAPPAMENDSDDWAGHLLGGRRCLLRALRPPSLTAVITIRPVRHIASRQAGARSAPGQLLSRALTHRGGENVADCGFLACRTSFH
jgi:hypothetical protein